MAHPGITISIALFALLLQSVPSLAAEKSASSNTCRFGGTEYEVGHVFHPRLETQGTVFCVTCQCFQGGRTNCSSRECPTVRCAEEDASECCRICKESRPMAAPMVPATSSLATVTPTTPSAPTTATKANAVVCVHNGKVHNEGDTFQSNNTGMQTESANQCVQCRCEEGMVLCDIQTCEDLPCLEAVVVPGKCCPSCPAARDATELGSPITFTDYSAPRDRRDKDCISAGKYYMDGSSWHPVIGPLGPMDCVMCVCSRGNIVCNRFRCPSKLSLSCSRPVKQFGQCCPVCPLPGASKDSITEDGPRKCVNAVNERLVYRAEGAGNLSHVIQYAFQKLASQKSEVELHSWVLHGGLVETFHTQIITLQDFSQLVNRFKFSVLGASTSKSVVKFGRREKKIQKRCVINCILKIQRLEDNLNLQKIINRKRCLPTEIQITPL